MSRILIVNNICLPLKYHIFLNGAIFFVKKMKSEQV